MIKTKEELFKELKKSRSSALDSLIEYKISEKVLREILKDREEDNKYFFEKLDEVNKHLEYIVKSIKKKDYEIARLIKSRNEWKKIANNLKEQKQEKPKAKLKGVEE